MVKMVETEVECCKIISEDVKDAVVLKGSPELGLIGNILGWLLVEELNMKQIGYIDSKDFPPLAVLYKGIAIHPFRIYSSKGIVLFLSDFIIHQMFHMTCPKQCGVDGKKQQQGTHNIQQYGCNGKNRFCCSSS